MARAWPALSRALEPTFAARFAAYAETNPLPRTGGSLADGRAFARWLATRSELCDAGRLEALAVDLRFATVSGGLRPRRGPALQVAPLADGRLVLAWRLPLLGEHWFSVPCRLRRRNLTTYGLTRRR